MAVKTPRAAQTPRQKTARISSASHRKPTNRKKRKKGTASMTRKTRAVLIRLCVVLFSGLLCYWTYIYFVEPYTSRWNARYGNEIYPEGYSIRGIDVSHHQGNIDWEKLSRANIGKEAVNFVFVKATEGKNFLDENFNDNFYEAREIGLIRGAYHYFKPGVPAKEQAEYYLKQVHLEAGDLPPVLDIEETGQLSKEQLQKAAKTWLDIVEKHYGVPPILYTGYKFRESYLNSKDFERYPYWIAHYYVSKLAYKGKWKFWQHTDCGKVGGIKGNVDFNIYNGSMYDLRRLCLADKDEDEQ